VKFNTIAHDVWLLLSVIHEDCYVNDASHMQLSKSYGSRLCFYQPRFLPTAHWQKMGLR